MPINQMIGILNAAQSFAGTMSDAREFDKQKKFEGDYNTYLKDLTQNTDHIPDFDSPDFNPDAFNKALGSAVTAEADKLRLDANRLDKKRAQINAGRARMEQGAQQAEAAYAATGDEHSAVTRYVQMLNDDVNGITGKYNPTTKMWDFEDKVADERWSRYVTLNDARQIYQSMAAPGEYERFHLTNLTTIEQANKVALSNPKILVDKDGNRIHMFGFFDPETGNAKPVYIDFKKGEAVELSDEDLINRGLRPFEQVQGEEKAGLGLEKDRADIAYTKQATESLKAQDKDRATRAAAEGKPSALEGQVNLYAKIFNISEQEALQLVREEKTAHSRLAQAMKKVNDLFLDPDNPDDQETIKGIMLEFGVQNIPGVDLSSFYAGDDRFAFAGLGEDAAGPQEGGRGLGIGKGQDEDVLPPSTEARDHMLRSLGQQFPIKSPKRREGEEKYVSAGDGINHLFVYRKGKWQYDKTIR